MAKKGSTNGRTAAPPRTRPSNIDRFLALSDEEKAAMIAQYDAGPIPFSETSPLTPAERQAWKRAQAGLKAAHADRQRRSRSVAGKGAKGIQVTIDGGLLADADAFAASQGLKRAQLIAVGLRLAMTASIDELANLVGN